MSDLDAVLAEALRDAEKAIGWVTAPATDAIWTSAIRAALRERGVELVDAETLSYALGIIPQLHDLFASDEMRLAVAQDVLTRGILEHAPMVLRSLRGETPT